MTRSDPNPSCLLRARYDEIMASPPGRLTAALLGELRDLEEAAGEIETRRAQIASGWNDWLCAVLAPS